MPRRKAVHLACPIRLGCGLRKTVTVYFDALTCGAYQAFQLFTSRQSPVSVQLFVRNNNGLGHIIMIQADDVPFTACAIPLLANRTAHPFNAALQINNQMIASQKLAVAEPRGTSLGWAEDK